MSTPSRPATLGSALCTLFVLGLLLSLAIPATAQKPEPPVPETVPGPPAATVGATATYPKDAAAEVKAVELQRFATLVKGDADLLGRVLGEDLTYTHSSGAVDT